MSINFFKEPVRGSWMGREEVNAIESVLASGQALSRGPEIEKFENLFAKHLGVKYCVAVSSCTVALRLAFQSINLQNGDHILVPVNAFWNAVCSLAEKGVEVTFIDLYEHSLTIDTDLLKKSLRRNTKAILSYSHGGNPSNMTILSDFCKSHNLTLIEDCAHGNGSLWDNKSIAEWADISCYSFSTLKNMSTLGEGGIIATNSSEIYEKVSNLRSAFPLGHFKKPDRGEIGEELSKFLKPGDFFVKEWTSIESIGSKFVMTSPQAAVGIVQLSKLGSMNNRRKEIAGVYNDFLSNFPLVSLWQINQKSKCSWHLFHFFIKRNNIDLRDKIVHEMRLTFGIELVNRFWPLTKNSIFTYQASKGECPNYENQIYNSIMAFPISPIMTNEEVNYILDSFEKSYARSINSA
jgi:perosamine synthetase